MQFFFLSMFTDCLENIWINEQIEKMKGCSDLTVADINGSNMRNGQGTSNRAKNQVRIISLAQPVLFSIELIAFFRD